MAIADELSKNRVTVRRLLGEMYQAGEIDKDVNGLYHTQQHEHYEQGVLA